MRTICTIQKCTKVGKILHREAILLFNHGTTYCAIKNISRLLVCYCCAFTHFSHSWNRFVRIYMAVRGRKYYNINKCPHCLCVLLWFAWPIQHKTELYSNVKLCTKCALYTAFRFLKCRTVYVVYRWEQIWFAVCWVLQKKSSVLCTYCWKTTPVLIIAMESA